MLLPVWVPGLSESISLLPGTWPVFGSAEAWGQARLLCGWGPSGVLGEEEPAEMSTSEEQFGAGAGMEVRLQ